MSKLAKRILSCLIIVLMFNIPVLASMPSEEGYIVEKETVVTSYELGLVTKDMAERCLESLNREDAAEILYRLYYAISEEEEKNTEITFRDTEDKESNAACQLGLMDGYSRTVFGSAILISREKFAEYMYDTVKLAGKEIDLNSFYYDKFSDSESIDPEYEEKIFYLAGIDVIDVSEDDFNPQEYISIEEASVMAFNAYEFYSEKLIYINGKGIGIGDSEEKLKEEFGEPDKIYVSEYNSNRYVYLLENGYLFAGINENGEIEEIFTNCNDFEYYNYSPDTDIFEFKHEDPHINYKYTIDDCYSYTNLYFDGQDFKVDGIYLRANHLKGHVMRLDEFYNNSIKEEIMNLVNTGRMVRGLKPYVICEHASEIAARQSGYMSLKALLTHEYVGGENLFERLYKSGVNFMKVSQNISCTTESAVDIFYYWTSVPGMRNNIYSEEFKYVGLGCFINKNLIYTAMVFYV